MRKILTFVMLISTILIVVSCRSSLELKINSAKDCKDESYGFSMNNPICIKYKNVSSDSIINVYVNKLWNNNQSINDKNIINIRQKGDSIIQESADKKYWNMISYHVIKIRTILITLENKKNKLLRECTIKSDNDKQTIVLYFNTNKSDRKLKVPFGFFFSRLSGK